MKNLHADANSTTRTVRLPRWTGVLAAGAVAFGAVIGFAGSAQAATITSYRVTGTNGAGSAVVSNPTNTTRTKVTTLADGTTFTIDCGIRGTGVHGNTVWHHITAPVTGYIADYYTNTPGYNQLAAGESTCAAAAPVGTTPVTPAPVATTPVATAPVTPVTPTPVATPSVSAGTRGQTITYNEGVSGSCVDYAMDRFHQLTGVYPKAFGDARLLPASAAKYGWTVVTTPQVNSIVIFQPGDNGAASTGHAAWVEQVSGTRIYISEMNAPVAGVVTHRWIDAPAASVRYILAA